MDNTSGQGKDATVPEEVKGLSWGGFFWNWLWGLFNRVWLSLLVFIPVIGLFVPFVLLFKGREWAWQNKTWESVEHFNRVQRKWTIAALIFLGVGLAIMAGAVFMGGLLDDGPGSPSQASMSVPTVSPTLAPAPRPVAVPAAAPAPSTPKPEAVVVAQAPKVIEAPKTVTLVAAAPVLAPALAAAAPARAAPALRTEPAARAEAPAAEGAPRARRERSAQPVPMAAVGGVEPKVYTPKYNDLMTAVLRPDRQGVTELLDLGRWVDKPDASGVTPFLAAVRNRDTAMAELLLARGANVNATAPNGLTALAIARANADTVMTTLLQRSGAGK